MKKETEETANICLLENISRTTTGSNVQEYLRRHKQEQMNKYFCCVPNLLIIKKN